MGLLLWILMAVGPAGISTRLRGELAENGGGAHMHREDTVVGAPRAPNREFAARTALCVCARGHLRSVPTGPRENERVHVRAGVVGGSVCVDGEESYTHSASITMRCEFGVTWVIHLFRID